MSATPLTTLTLFGIKKGNWRWGLAQMGTMPPRLKQEAGLQFFKLLGSGKDRVFSLKPDFYLYGMMAVWENEIVADYFLNHSPIIKEYQQHCDEIWTVKLLPLRSHGLWDGINPFKITEHNNSNSNPIAVLTRAAINIKALPAFWRYGKHTSQALDNATGLLAAVGLGELPLIRQATFSIWENEQQITQYAYKNAHHQEVIRKTRSDNWYNEELFARFQVLSATGTWKGCNPLS